MAKGAAPASTAPPASAAPPTVLSPATRVELDGAKLAAYKHYMETPASERSLRGTVEYVKTVFASDGIDMPLSKYMLRAVVKLNRGARPGQGVVLTNRPGRQPKPAAAKPSPPPAKRPRKDSAAGGAPPSKRKPTAEEAAQRAAAIARLSARFAALTDGVEAAGALLAALPTRPLTEWTVAELKHVLTYIAPGVCSHETRKDVLVAAAAKAVAARG